MIIPLAAPVLYALELTAACNNRCPGCYNPFAGDRSIAPLTLDQWRIVLERIRPYAYLVKLTGGEPTLYPHLADILSLLDAFQIGFSLFTNARWRDPAQVLRLLNARSSFRGLLISLHGTTAGAHEAFTGVTGSFIETVENIRRAVSAGLPVVLSTVIHRHNLDQLAGLPLLCAELGADHVSYNRYLGPPQPELELPHDALRQAIHEIETLSAQGARVRFGNCIPHCFASIPANGCLAGVAYCTVDPWGQVRPCNHSPTRCGSLLDRPIEVIWNGAAMDGWRGRIPSDCHTCAAFAECHGGCRAQAELLGLAADPLMAGALDRTLGPRTITLGLNWRPRLICEVRPQPFGYVLLRGNNVVPLAAEDRVLLAACDGQTMLRELREQFGERGLQILYDLYRQGVVDMQWTGPARGMEDKESF